MSAPAFELSFLGAAETVTGSRYLLDAGGTRLLVDCGLFQGYKKLRQRNWTEPGFEAASVDAVVLSHAHLDHSGYLPRLVRASFEGPVYATPGTIDLLRILLPDAAHLQEEEAKWAASAGYSKHSPPLPLFTREDVERCLTLLQPLPFGERTRVAGDIHCTLSRAGHIVGSASVLLEIAERRLVFSGDVGRLADPVMKPPALLPACDYLVVESTYGDRRHSSASPANELAGIVREAAATGGAVVIPAFAVGRAQHVLHLLATLLDAGQIPSMPIFLDSPMAIEATGIYRAHPEEHALSAEQCRRLGTVAHYSSTSEESKRIDQATGPMIIISASGMATGGRVLHHLKRFLPDERSSIVLVGYQGAGTRGRLLADGAQELKIHGQYVPVRARVRKIDGLSAHADYSELLEWIGKSGIHPRRTFITHGEPAASDALRRHLRDALGIDAVIPDHGSRYPLS